ncbi:MAG TPA: hypothetical protein VHC67_19170 [Gaiellaceae bacterium]|nr:hypothetical protein [Gaiellaceae bacterium]
MSGRLLVAAACAAALLGANVTTAHATTAQAEVVRTSLQVAGKPFFPVMLLDQCDAAATARARTLGVNLILNESCPGVSPQGQLGLLAGRQLGVLPIQARGSSGSRLAGWTYPDEPENNGWTPAKLARAFPYARGSSDGLVSFVTTTSAFFRPPYRDRRISPATVRGFARLADIAGFDLYPLNHCQSDLASVYDAQRAFVRLVGGMPTFQWIETGPLDPSYCGGFRMTPAELRAEAWLAVVGGARGIGFFTQTVEPASTYSVAPDVEHAIQRFSSLAAAVQPGLVGATIPSGANSPAIKVLARSAPGSTYVFGVNSLTQPVRVQVEVPNLANGRLRVFGEHRTVTVSNHRFVDLFTPLAVHVYVQDR